MLELPKPGDHPWAEKLNAALTATFDAAEGISADVDAAEAAAQRAEQSSVVILAPTDDQVASLLSNTATATGRRTRALRPPLAHASGIDHLAALRDFGRGSLTCAVAGSSETNDADDWFRIVMREFGETLPSAMRREYKLWNHATQSYVTTVDAAGTGTPASGGTVMHDTFTRTVADIVGSTSDNGKTWAGMTGKWSADGTGAYPVATPGGIAYNVGSRDATMTAQLAIVTTAPAVQLNRRFFLGAPNGTAFGAGLWAQIAINTAGQPILTLWKTIAGVTTQLGASVPITGLTFNSPTPQQATLAVSIAIQNVSVTVTVAGVPFTVSGTLTESEYAGLGTFAWLAALDGAPVSAGNRVESVTIDTPYTPASYDGLTALNGAVGGTTLEYQRTRVATMYPASQPIQTLFVLTGHNLGNGSPATMIAELAAFLDAFRAIHPDVDVVVVSQNPQKVPSTSVAAHATRQAALRAWTTRQGLEYVPVFEAFTAQPGRGLSLVQADGIHPTTPGIADLSVWSGARLWADLVLAAIDARAASW